MSLKENNICKYFLSTNVHFEESLEDTGTERAQQKNQSTK